MTRLALALAGGLLVAAQAQAQTLYRCGSAYQDRPCDAGKKRKVVGSSGAAGSATQTGGIDAECVQRGRDSNKIVWAREGGATQERLLSEASASERRLIESVYRRPGAGSSVQAAVEADCVAEKQREAQEAAPPSPPEVSPDPRPQYEADQRKRQCARYADDMDRLRDQERAGGSASTMDALNERRRSLRQRMSKAGC